MRNYQDDQFKSAARAIKALAANGGHAMPAIRELEHRYGDKSAEALFLEKAAVSPALTTSAGWAGNLSETVGNALFDSAKEAGIHGQLTQVPANTKLNGIATGAAAAFVAEGSPVPITSLTVSGDELPTKRVVATLVITKELARLSDPRAEAVFERELRTAIVNAIDGAVLSADAATADTPAGLFNGVTPHTATAGETADIRELVDDFGGDLTTAFFAGSPKVLASLNSDARPLVGIRNGELLNAPALASRNAPAGTLALIDGAGVAYADEGFEVSIASNASVIMSDGPSSPGQQVSFFQAGLIGIRITRHVDWATVRPGSVAFISGAAW